MLRDFGSRGLVAVTLLELCGNMQDVLGRHALGRAYFVVGLIIIY